MTVLLGRILVQPLLTLHALSRDSFGEKRLWFSGCVAFALDLVELFGSWAQDVIRWRDVCLFLGVDFGGFEVCEDVFAFCVFRGRHPDVSGALGEWLLGGGHLDG
jgi:hypothetical protein